MNVVEITSTCCMFGLFVWLFVQTFRAPPQRLQAENTKNPDRPGPPL